MDKASGQERCPTTTITELSDRLAAAADILDRCPSEVVWLARDCRLAASNLVTAETRVMELEEHLASLPNGFREWSAQIDAIEAQTINKCACIADSHQRGLKNGGAINACRSIATAIRALGKTKVVLG